MDARRGNSIIIEYLQIGKMATVNTNPVMLAIMVASAAGLIVSVTTSAEQVVIAQNMTESVTGNTTGNVTESGSGNMTGNTSAVTGAYSGSIFEGIP